MYDPWIKYTLGKLEFIKGVRVLHSIDARNIHEQVSAEGTFGPEGFDLVVWNHPHSGFPCNHPTDHKGPGFEQSDAVLGRHRALVRDFFISLSKPGILRENARVCISHKSIHPFDKWDIPALAKTAGFTLSSSFPLQQQLFPEYVCRRGTGKSPAKMFPSSDSRTYVFSL